MNPKFKRTTAISNTPNYYLKWKEANILRKWAKTKGNIYLEKFKNVPEVVCVEYENFLLKSELDLKIKFTSEERLFYIKELIEWYLQIEPAFKRLLKITRLNNSQFGKALGYKSASSWYNSRAKVRLIKGFLVVFENYRSIINNCFNC